MTGPTFGEFAGAATWHLRELQVRGVRLRVADEPGAAAADVVVADIGAAVHAIAAYADDASAALSAADLTDDHTLGPWIRAAHRARQELAGADAVWDNEAVPDPSAVRLRSADHSVSGLHAASRYMTLGRDLLHTHQTSRPGRPETDWTPVVTSAPIACALLQLVGGWARQIAPHAGHLAVSGRSLTPPDQQMLNAASRALWIASWAIGTAQEHRPVRLDELQLLGAIPLAGSPLARLPARDATVPDLCDGIASTAQRLRAAARHAVTDAAWSPSLTRESLRQTAGCCAITASNLRIILRTMAANRDGPFAQNSASLARAAEAANNARARWLQAAGAWDSITTDTHGYRSPAAVEAAALAQWTGRLAYASPDWTPALGPEHTLRPASELASDHGSLGQVVETLHEVGRTIVVAAEVDCVQLRTASAHGRLIVPTRSLPESFDVPYRFAPAPGIRTEPLLSCYDRALNASEHAAAALTHAAAEVHAPIRTAGQWPPRAAARTSGSVLVTAQQHQSPNRQTALLPPAAPPHPAASKPEPLPAGPVERILLDLDVSNRADLKHAAALDAAADQLILRAAAAARQSWSSRDPARSVGSAELITHLLISSDGTVPPALQPAHRAPVVQHTIERHEQAHHQSRPPPRQPEAEAGA